ncbi:MAG: YihY/virulence factor BrkB family protein [Saprospiraceae bacterium]|nr:YihY/virulence factor BrkB family protein [Saprospiraceae bacterium]
MKALNQKKKTRLQTIWHLTKTTAIHWYNRDPFREGSIIAYSAIFALPGLLVVILTIAGYFFGEEAVSGMGVDTADQIEQMVAMAASNSNSWIASIIGIATIFIGATAVFVQMQRSLNNIWEVEATTKKSGIWNIIKTRIFSFGLIVSIAFLLLISLVMSSLLSALSDWLKQYWSESLMSLFQYVDVIISIGIITILFALMLKILPDAKIKSRSVWLGAFITAILFVIGKTGLGFYFGTAEPGSGYGAAGSVILIMLWTSYSSMIVFLGAEFTKVYTDYYFGAPPPTEIAKKIPESEKKDVSASSS